MMVSAVSFCSQLALIVAPILSQRITPLNQGGEWGVPVASHGSCRAVGLDADIRNKPSSWRRLSEDLIFRKWGAFDLLQSNALGGGAASIALAIFPYPEECGRARRRRSDEWQEAMAAANASYIVIRAPLHAGDVGDSNRTLNIQIIGILRPSLLRSEFSKTCLLRNGAI